MEPINLDDYRPHVNFYFDDKIETYPLAFFEEVVAEKQPLSRLTRKKNVLLAILEEWLLYVKDNSIGNEY